MRQWDVTQTRWKCPLNPSLVSEGWKLPHFARFNVANGKKRIRCSETKGRKGLGKRPGHVSVIHLYCTTGHCYLQNADSLKQKRVNSCKSQMREYAQYLPCFEKTVIAFAPLHWILPLMIIHVLKREVISPGKVGLVCIALVSLVNYCDQGSTSPLFLSCPLCTYSKSVF